MLKKFFMWFLWGLFFLALLPCIVIYFNDYYLRTEPHFGSPVWIKNNILQTRMDSYGKGYFGASRNGNRTHQGIDFTSTVGYPVYAAGSGRATIVKEEKGYGKYIEILHPNQLKTRYAHLSSLAIAEGAWVKKGQEIGKIGKTGNAGNPAMIAHLHFEIRLANKAVDPSKNLLDPAILIK